MSKFTPGPWEVKMFPDGTCFVSGKITEDHPYARVMRDRGIDHIEIMSDDEYPRKLADATLIASAPDLAKRAEATEVLVEALRRIAEDGPGLFIRSSARCALDEYERRLKDENP